MPALVLPGRARRAWVDPRALRFLRHTVGRLQPSVVVCHGMEPLKYAALLPKAHRPGLVCLGIGTVHSAARTGVRRYAYQRAVASADVMAGVSREVCEQIRDLFGRPDVLLLVNGRNPAEYPVRQRDRTGPPVVVFVGHLVHGKRPELFVDVVRRLRAEGLCFRARIAGSGPLAGVLAGAASAANVELLGRRGDVAALLADSDLLVFTSEPDGEGMPGVLIEAGLAGLPVVATDVPGVRDIVVDGVTGALVGVDDIDQLTAASRRLLTDPELRAQMGRRARIRCETDFSLAGGVDGWRHAISLAATGRARRP